MGEWVQAALDANVDLQTKGKKNTDGQDVCLPPTLQNKPDSKISGTSKVNAGGDADIATAGASVAHAAVDCDEEQVAAVEQTFLGLQSELGQLRHRMDALKARLATI